MLFVQNTKIKHNKLIFYTVGTSIIVKQERKTWKLMMKWTQSSRKDRGHHRICFVFSVKMQEISGTTDKAKYAYRATGQQQTWTVKAQEASNLHKEL